MDVRFYLQYASKCFVAREYEEEKNHLLVKQIVPQENFVLKILQKNNVSCMYVKLFKFQGSFHKNVFRSQKVF